VFDADALHPVCAVFRTFLLNLSSLEALSPQLLRKRSREKTDSLGMGGEKLSAYIHGLPLKKRNQLSEWLRECYPHLEGVMTSSQKAGWKKLSIKENYEKSFVTEDRHINDGMLRMMAILAETLTDHQFLLFDEIENGLHPEIIEFLLKKLQGAKQQVTVTTHSPVILNYLDDETAKEGVVLLYKTPEGYTQAKRLFDIPAMARKLEVMGPGEAFADTDFPKLIAKRSTGKK
jgi:predicted ATPase